MRMTKEISAMLIAVLIVSYISAGIAITVVDGYAEEHLATHHSTSLEPQP